MKIRKKVIYCIALLLLTMLWVSGTVHAATSEFAGGSGTETDPYLIETKEHLNNVRNHLDAHYKMIANIEFSDADFEEGGVFYNESRGWQPIGDKENWFVPDADDGFTGIFDGNGNAILGLYINTNTERISYSGLFACNNGIIKNLSLRNAVVKNISTNHSYAAGISGYNHSGTIMDVSVVDCLIISESSAASATAGGISAYANKDSCIYRCYNTSDVYSKAGGYALSGGILGSGNGRISDCYNTGYIEAYYTSTSFANPSVGGILGNAQEMKVENCYNVGRINAMVKEESHASKNVGGICGTTYSNHNFTNCYYIFTQDTGIGDSTEGDGNKKCTLEEMKNSTTYKGWDFENVWTINSIEEYPLPILKSTPHITANYENTDFAGGSGEPWDPFIIENVEQLNNVRNNLDVHYALGNDIHFSEGDFSENGQYYNEGQGWLSIGSKTNPFTGSFDGRNHTILGLNINSKIASDIYVGLFGYASGTIKNISISDSNITVIGDSNAQSTDYLYAYIGSVAGYGNVENCHNSGTVNITYSSTTLKCYVYAGGVNGRGGKAVECSNSGSLSLNVMSTSGNYVYAYLGGISGRTENVERCQNNGNVIADTLRNDSRLYIGGIVGSAMEINKSGNIAQISASGNIINDVNVGGICGLGMSDSIINQCYNTGFIEGVSEVNAGGIVGYIGGNGSVNDSFNNGYIKGGYCGGIVGTVFGAVTIKSCYNTGFIQEGFYRYAIIGNSSETSVIANCYSLKGVAKTRTLTNVCSLQEMCQKETYKGFDFDSVWRMGVSSNYLFPELINIPVDNKVKDISICDITLDKDKVQYKTVQPTVAITYNGELLQLGKDYSLQYTMGDETWMANSGESRIMGSVGTAKILVIGMDKFINNKEIEFEVVKFDLANAELYTSFISDGVGGQTSSRFIMEDFTYDGTEKKQNGYRVGYNYDSISSDNYDITYNNNIEAGVATLVISGKGELYTGKLEKKFNIYPRNIEKIVITTKPKKLTYLEGENFDKTGMVVTAYYNNGTNAIVNDYSISGYTSSVGTKTIIVSYEGKNDKFTVTVTSRVPSTITSSKYNIRESYISKITFGTTVNSLLTGLNEGAYCRVYNGNSITSDSAVVGTGMSVKIMDKDVVKTIYSVIVTGDTNGDGNCTVTDMITIKAHVLKKTLMFGALAVAADTNGDGSISITDFIQVKAKILGKGSITAK